MVKGGRRKATIDNRNVGSAGKGKLLWMAKQPMFSWWGGSGKHRTLGHYYISFLWWLYACTKNGKVFETV